MGLMVDAVIYALLGCIKNHMGMNTHSPLLVVLLRLGAAGTAMAKMGGAGRASASASAGAQRGNGYLANGICRVFIYS